MNISFRQSSAYYQEKTPLQFKLDTIDSAGYLLNTTSSVLGPDVARIIKDCQDQLLAQKLDITDTEKEASSLMEVITHFKAYTNTSGTKSTRSFSPLRELEGEASQVKMKIPLPPIAHRIWTI